MSKNVICKTLGELIIPSGKRVLVTGASGDIGVAFLKLISRYDVTLGMHYYSNKNALNNFVKDGASKNCKSKLFYSDLSKPKNCFKLIKTFVDWAGGIDYLIQLSGTIKKPVTWQNLSVSDWQYDINVNLTAPFFLAQRAFGYMQANGGKIVLMSTASSKHGAGGTSLAYGVAKSGVECLTKALAREGAEYNILVNCIAPGFIDTKFQTEKAGKTRIDFKKRVELIPLKRAGLPKDVAGMILYLLSDWGDYITGEIINISGGDWL